jgi:hypothetical protein
VLARPLRLGGAILLLFALFLTAHAALAGNRYADCGGNGERACCLFPEFRLPACDSDLIQALGVGPGTGQGPLGCSLGTCYGIDGQGFPFHCGDPNEPASGFR